MVSGFAVKDLGFTLKSRERSCFIFGKPVNSVDFLVLFVVGQIVVTVSVVRPHPSEIVQLTRSRTAGSRRSFQQQPQ